MSMMENYTNELDDATTAPERDIEQYRSRYTDNEWATLSEIPCWDPSQPTPAGLAGVILAITKDRGILPGQPLPYSILNPDEQQRILHVFEEAERHAKDHDANGPIVGAGPGVNELLSGDSVRQIELDDDLDANDSRVVAPADPDVEHAVCPRCGWNTAEPLTVTATAGDKQDYGGKLHVDVRELSTFEEDLLAKQYQLSAAEGGLSPQLLDDYLRWRMCLQLQAIYGPSAHKLLAMPGTLAEWGIVGHTHTPGG